MADFNAIHRFLSCFQKETLNNFEGKGLHPAELHAEMWELLLRELPCGVSGKYILKGEFGMDFVPESGKANWQKRFDAPAAAEKPVMNPWHLYTRGFSVQAEDKCHTTPDYENVLKYGLRGIYDSIPADSVYRNAMRKELLAVKAFGTRFDCAVPWEPAETLEDALQSLWLTHCLIAFSESAGCSLSFGRFDRYMLPYCEGRTDEEIMTLLADFFRLINNPFMDGAQNLNLGGEQGFNRLSRLILKTARKIALPAPILAVRYHESITGEDFRLACCRELACIGQPTFYGEESCRESILMRGVPASETNEDWAANSCMGIILPGREIQSMWGIGLSVPFFLELALNQGKPTEGEEIPLPLEVSVPETYASFDELFDTVIRIADAWITHYVNAEQDAIRKRMKFMQNPFLSTLYRDCAERGKDMLDDGVRYRTTVVETFGLVNTIDALYTVQELVFHTGRHTLAELAEAVKNQFRGEEKLLQEIKALPKFGQNHEKVNELTKRFSNALADKIIAHNTDHFFYAPSLHTLNLHTRQGGFVSASLDGRLCGEPLAKNSGTAPGIHADHTSLLLSALQIPQKRFTGGQPVDLYFPSGTWDSPEQLANFRALLRVWFNGGGLQLQINSVDVNTLQDAMEHPENYPDLTVRIGGYSMRFNQLNRAQQEDFIRRFKAGM